MINRKRQENRQRRRKRRRERRQKRRSDRRNKFAAEGGEIFKKGFLIKFFDFFKSIFIWIYKYLISPILSLAFAYTISFFVINVFLKFSGLVKEVNMKPKVINFSGDGIISLFIFIFALWIKIQISNAKKTGISIFPELNKKQKFDPSKIGV